MQSAIVGELCRVLPNAGNDSRVLAQLVADTVSDYRRVMLIIAECWRLQLSPPLPRTTDGH